MDQNSEFWTLTVERESDIERAVAAIGESVRKRILIILDGKGHKVDLSNYRKEVTTLRDLINGTVYGRKKATLTNEDEIAMYHAKKAEVLPPWLISESVQDVVEQLMDTPKEKFQEKKMQVVFSSTDADIQKALREHLADKELMRAESKDFAKLCDWDNDHRLGHRGAGGAKK